MENVMSSPESRLKPDHEIQLSDTASGVQPAGSESNQGPKTTTSSKAESLLAAEKRRLEMTPNGRKVCFCMSSCLIFKSRVDRGIPSLAAAPFGPQILRPRKYVSTLRPCQVCFLAVHSSDSLGRRLG